MVRLIQPFLLVFAKQNEKTHTKRQLLFYNKVVFYKKKCTFVAKYPSLKRDEWILLDKDHQPIGKNILELPRSVKKAWSPVEALLGSYLLK